MRLQGKVAIATGAGAAHDAIDRRDRPFLHETNKKRLV